MNNDYLWDRSGEPDPEIQQLENALTKFRYQGQPLAFARTTQFIPDRDVQVLRRSRAISFAAAAAVLLIIGFGIARWRLGQTPNVPASWDVARLAGAPRVGSHSIGESARPTGLVIGDTLETDGDSRATLTASSVGEVNVEPNTRLRLLASGPGRQRIGLDRGTIQATIWAPRGEFVVDTPSARAVDLGCAYRLHVDDSGAGLLRTTMGWVGFKLANRESLIPAGAVCATRPNVGPGTPYFEDAEPSLRQALSAFDFAASTPEERGRWLDLILKQARRQDALTLWHLFQRVDAGDRERLYERLGALVPPPRGVTREGILRLDRRMLDAWWNELGYGDVSLWRTFERSW